MRIALIGNPNSGKTTLFNELTGANQHVGNWPGVTVEQKTGQLRARYAAEKAGQSEVIDLPGIYSLSPFSLEEVVSRDFLVFQKPDVVVDIVDATNLERNLYLTIQLVELNLPLVVALNMMDEVARDGYEIDSLRLARDLGVQVVPVSAAGHQGISALMAALPKARPPKRHKLPNQPLEALIARVEELLYGHMASEQSHLDAKLRDYPLHWMALKVLEDDDLVLSQLTLDAESIRILDRMKSDFEEENGLLCAAFASARYNLIHHMLYRGPGIMASRRSKRQAAEAPSAEPGTVGQAGSGLAAVGLPTVGCPGEKCLGDECPSGLSTKNWKKSQRRQKTARRKRKMLAAFTPPPAAPATLLAAATAADAAPAAAPTPPAAATAAPAAPAAAPAATAAPAALAAPPDPLRRTDAIDRILTHRIWAVPIFLVLIFAIFHLTFSSSLFGIPGVPSPGVGLQYLVRAGLGALTTALQPLFVPGSWEQSLVIDGVIGGVGAVLSFVPQIILLFFFLTLMEDCGYMARAAFIMDRYLRRFGLSGKSFVPMLMGFGCTVPAVMAARTMENQNDRRLTLMLVPFMSCGARAPIYLVMAGAFFAGAADFMVFGLYLLGILVAVLSGIMLRKLLFKGEFTPFLIELPRYRMPRARSVLQSLWENLRGYLVRAGTVIFAMCVVIWALSNFGFANGGFGLVPVGSSLLATLGGAIAPAFLPLGFGTYIAAVALLSGLVAKESVISSLGTLVSTATAGTAAATATATTTATAVGLAGLSASTLAAVGFTPPAALSFMVFCLLYMPCVAAFATLKKEFGSLKWAIGQAAYSIAVAYIVALVVYQIARLFYA